MYVHMVGVLERIKVVVECIVKKTELVLLKKKETEIGKRK